MKLNIDTPRNDCIKREDVTATDAIAVLEVVNVMCITLVDPFTEEAELDKTMC
jgi:hypothetical protein